jgi:molecular chaperone DnaK
LTSDPRPHGDAAAEGDAAEKAKIELSGLDADQYQPALYHPRARLLARCTWISSLTRAKFNELTADLVEKPRWALSAGPWRTQASRPNRSIKVILVGGSTRIPAVQEAIKKLMGKEADQERQPR